MTFSLHYYQVPSDDIKTGADIIKNRFENIDKSLKGLEKLKEVEPSGKPKITAAYSKTPLDSFKCPDGELLQGNICGKFLHV